MQKTTITFENEDGTKKAIIAVEPREDDPSGNTADINLTFLPELCSDLKVNDATYAAMAIDLMKYLHSVNEITDSKLEIEVVNDEL